MKIYNSLTNSVQEFRPLQKNKVTVYVCGITPYDTTHLGHAFTYIFFDTFIKYLNYKKYDVEYTQNVTDINDKDNDILKKAHEQNIPWEKLADFWTQRFLDDMQHLNWTKPDHYLKASEQIPAMIELISQLLANNLAYQKSGSVFLDVKKFPDYGQLSKFSEAKMLKLAKDFEEDLTNPDKKHPLDITLWKATSPHQPPHIPAFDSPYGKGRPGWHIECSTMAISSLGKQIDIHGGGQDLIYPHHESEIVQSQGATNQKPFVKYWMHTGAVYYQGEKMSKSLGNLVMVSKLLEKYSPNAIRWVLLSHPWQQDWEFSNKELDQATQIIQKIQNNSLNLEYSSPQLDATRNDVVARFEQAMEDNLNTSQALEIIQQAAKEQNPLSLKLLNILGFTF